MGRFMMRTDSAYCPHCEALYHVIKLEAASETVERQTKCTICDEPLPAGDGSFLPEISVAKGGPP
jgi:hypothetical protein